MIVGAGKMLARQGSAGLGRQCAIVELEWPEITLQGALCKTLQLYKRPVFPFSPRFLFLGFTNHDSEKLTIYLRISRAGLDLFHLIF